MPRASRLARVRMLTTLGLASRAILRKVVESTGPEIGLLFAAGTSNGRATDAGVRPRWEAMTMPTTSEASAMSTP